MNTALNSSPQPATPEELPGPAVTAELQHQMDQHAQSVIDTILSHDLDSPAFVGEAATQVRSLGSEVMRSTGDLTNGLLDSKGVDLRGAFRPGQETGSPRPWGSCAATWTNTPRPGPLLERRSSGSSPAGRASSPDWCPLRLRPFPHQGADRPAGSQ